MLPGHFIKAFADERNINFYDYVIFKSREREVVLEAFISRLWKGR